MSDLEILRRIAERGLKKAQSEQSDYTDLFQHMIDEIARAKTGAGNAAAWISVKDRLPERTNYYVCASVSHGVWTGMFSEDSGQWVDDLDDPIEVPFTHWMPLPTPPEESA